MHMSKVLNPGIDTNIGFRTDTGIRFQDFYHYTAGLSKLWPVGQLWLANGFYMTRNLSLKTRWPPHGIQRNNLPLHLFTSWWQHFSVASQMEQRHDLLCSYDCFAPKPTFGCTVCTLNNRLAVHHIAHGTQQRNSSGSRVRLISEEKETSCCLVLLFASR